MNILINDVEMPENCGKCFVGDRTICREGCPLVPVPPHGRTIDSDALWVKINNICDCRDAGIITDLTCLQKILSAVRHAPTIIPANKEEEHNGN